MKKEHQTLIDEIIDKITDIQDEDQQRNVILELQERLSEELKNHSSYDTDVDKYYERPKWLRNSPYFVHIPENDMTEEKKSLFVKECNELLKGLAIPSTGKFCKNPNCMKYGVRHENKGFKRNTYCDGCGKLMDTVEFNSIPPSV